MSKPALNPQERTMRGNSRGMQGRLPRRSLQKNPPLFYYFFHLAEKFESVEDFKDKWRDIPATPFNAKGYSLILGKTLRFIRQYPGSKEDQKALRSHVRNHLHLWEKSALSEIPNFRSESPSLVLNACAYLRRTPSENLWAALENNIVHHIDQDNYSGLSYSMTLNGYARFGRNLPDFLRSPLIERFKKKIEAEGNGQGNAQKIYNSLYTCAVLGSLYPDSGYQDLALFLKKHLPEKIDDKKAQKQIFDSFQHFGWEPPCEQPELDEITSYNEQRLKHWFNEAGFETTRKPGLLSPFENAIDFPAQKNGQILLIESDGPTHFLTDRTHSDPDNPRYNGPTIFQSRLIHKQRPDLPILRVPYTVDICIGQKTQKNPDLRTQILESFAAQVKAQGPGIYRALYDERKQAFTIGRLRPDLQPHRMEPRALHLH